MKRCPQCNRVETDDALTFCRVDGTPLIHESGDIGDGEGTLRFSSAPATVGSRTRALSQAGESTEETVTRTTAAGTEPDGQPAAGPTRKLTRAKSRTRVVIAAAATIAIVLAASAYFYLPRDRNSAAKNSVAVLPFVNASGDAEMEYLSDGITESLINSLSQLPNVRVMARTTMFTFKGKNDDPRVIGKQLGVDAVLTGKVVQRVTASLFRRTW